ncbi:MAG TPA: hypothetical protein VIF62_15520 [Labilithrix sp.]|jgi:hypothetical protein
MGQEKDDEKIFRVDTVPPPAGESDAYNAATKVGPVTSEAWAELIKEANEEGKASAAAKAASQPPASAKPPVSAKPPSSGAAKPQPPRPAASAKPPPSDTAELPRAYDREEDDEAATLLHPKARPTDAPRAPPAQMAPVLAPPLQPPPSSGMPLPPMASARPAQQQQSLPPVLGATSPPMLSPRVAWALIIFCLAIAFVGFAAWAGLSP